MERSPLESKNENARSPLSMLYSPALGHGSDF